MGKCLGLILCMWPLGAGACEAVMVSLFSGDHRSGSRGALARDEQWYFMRHFLNQNAVTRVKNDFVDLNRRSLLFLCDDFLAKSKGFINRISRSQTIAELQDIYSEIVLNDGGRFSVKMKFSEYLQAQGFRLPAEARWPFQVLLPISQAKKQPRMIARNETEYRSVSLAQTFENFFEGSKKNARVRESEVIIEDKTTQGNIEFLAFDHSGTMVNFTYFPAARTERKVPVPWACLSCHYNSAQRIFTREPQLFGGRLNLFEKFHTMRE